MAREIYEPRRMANDIVGFVTSLGMMNVLDEDQPYQVTQAGNTYKVVDDKDSTILECAQETGALHYATLLNRAYGRGYKSGYRAGKAAAVGEP